MPLPKLSTIALLLSSSLLATSVACVREMPVAAGAAADPRVATPPLAEGSGALHASFDADTIAPAAAPADGAHDHHHHHGAPAATPTAYTCPHHPDVVSDKPGTCPKCKMDLVPKEPEPKDDSPDRHEH